MGDDECKDCNEAAEALDAARIRIEDLERSAASARQIARVAMTHTGTRAIRVELVSTDTGLSLIICDPAGDEEATAKRIAKMLDVQLWALIGMQFTGDAKKVGSTD